MPKLMWDKTGERLYETGVDHGVLYLNDSTAPDTPYAKAYVWNGLVSVTESPSGAESNPQYADNIKYIDLVSAEEYKATIEAFTYPTEFAECDGTAFPVKGLAFGQQGRRQFGLSYRTLVGNDVEGIERGYKLHLVYGCQAAPSEKGYKTINDSPEAITFSWEVNTTATAVNTGDYKPVASVTINSLDFTPEKMKAVEDVLYGNDLLPARLPLPDELVELLSTPVTP